MSAPTVAPNGPILLARSALLRLTATPSDGALSLRAARVAGGQVIAGPGKMTATLDGHGIPLTPEANGTYLLSTRGQSGGSHSLSVVVSHDGIRELLTATVTVTQRQSIFDTIQGHGMSAWWVLNVAVVLIAVLIISRRRR